MISGRFIVGLLNCMADMCEEHEMKICRRCGKEYPLTAYYFRRSNQNKDGFRNLCKVCNGKNSFGKGQRKPDYRARQVKDGMSFCASCGKWLPLTSEYFAKNSHKGNVWGFAYKCKQCEGRKYGVYKRRVKEPSKEGYKVCNDCGKELPATLDYFNKANTKSGLYFRCKDCCREVYLKNRDRIYAKGREYKQKNRIKIRKWFKNRATERRKGDVQFNLAARLRTRTRRILQGGAFTAKSQELLGCSYLFFKEYFESLFTDGMTWDLFLQGAIHVDHVIPIAAFDLTKEDEVRKACHYSNLQPLWAKDNIRKGSMLGDKRIYRYKNRKKIVV